MNRRRRGGDGGENETGRWRRGAHRCVGDALIADTLMPLGGELFACLVFSLALDKTRVFDGVAQRVQHHALLRKQQQESQPYEEHTIARHTQY